MSGVDVTAIPTGFTESGKKSWPLLKFRRPTMSKAGELKMPSRDPVAHPVQFTRGSKVRWGLLLFLVLAGNVLVASVAWIIVRLVTG
jgi:hypothetical protein